MILVIDHRDSFVYNLVQLVSALGQEVRVMPSEGAAPEELLRLQPDGVILSPGPGRPEAAGCFVELIRQLPEATPLLGVCLGHQALGIAYGARVVRAPQPVHGKTSPICHRGGPLFEGLASPFAAGRYHSLVVERETLPEELEVTADTEAGLVMGLRHRRLPQFGVQFHPESILTPEGPRMMEGFLSLVAARV